MKFATVFQLKFHKITTFKKSLVFWGKQPLSKEKISTVGSLLFHYCFMFLSLLFLLPSLLWTQVFSSLTQLSFTAACVSHDTQRSK